MLPSIKSLMSVYTLVGRAAGFQFFPSFPWFNAIAPSCPPHPQLSLRMRGTDHRPPQLFICLTPASRCRQMHTTCPHVLAIFLCLLFDGSSVQPRSPFEAPKATCFLLTEKIRSNEKRTLYALSTTSTSPRWKEVLCSDWQPPFPSINYRRTFILQAASCPLAIFFLLGWLSLASFGGRAGF